MEKDHPGTTSEELNEYYEQENNAEESGKSLRKKIATM